jgi:hypothetical protein
MSGSSKENKNSFVSSTKRSNSKPPLLRTPLCSKRYTPYSRTPITGRVSRIPTKNPPIFDQQDGIVLGDTTNLIPVNKAKGLRKETPHTSLRKGKELSVINKDILSIVGKTWRVNYCSPLYDFKCKYSSLQNYKQLLSSHLESDAAKGFAFEVGQDIVNGKFKAEFETLKDFSYYDTDSTGIKVTVYSRKTTAKNRKDSETPVLDAIFCYFGNEFEYNRDVNCFTSLPLCLVKGPIALAKCVFSWFEAQFDCRITPMHLSPMELSWYASLWAGSVPEESNSNLELCYSVPSAAKGLNRVLYSINAHDAKGLWECCHNTNSAVFTGDESSSFMKALETHFYNHFKVNLGAMALTRIGTPLSLLAVRDV